MGEVFFTADLHFNHRWMAEHRGYSSLEEMNVDLAEQWNDTIGHRDVVHVLGDFSFGPAEAARSAFFGLRGAKHLIVGNHDSGPVKKLPWSSVNDFSPFRLNGQTAWLFHYPMLTWPNAHHGTWHLHGHSHGQLRAPESTRMDVGLDSTGRIALAWDEIVEILSARSYDFVDHHEG